MLRSGYSAGFINDLPPSPPAHPDAMDWQISDDPLSPHARVAIPDEPDLDLLYATRTGPAECAADEPPADVVRALVSEDMDALPTVSVEAQTLLSVPHVLAQCQRAAVQVALCACTALRGADNDGGGGGGADVARQMMLQSLAEAGEEVAASTAQLVDAARGGVLVTLALLLGAVLPAAARRHNAAITDTVFDLVRVCAGRGGACRFFLPAPFGDATAACVARAYDAARRLLGDAALDTLAHAPFFDEVLDERGRARVMEDPVLSGDPAARERRHVRRVRLNLDDVMTLGGKLQFLRLYFSSPVRAPLPSPPAEQRTAPLPDALMASRLDFALARQHSGADGGREYADSARAAVYKRASRPDQLRRQDLPLCALAAFYHSTDAGAGGARDVWHNRDRFLVANYVMDLAEYDIEDMADFFDQRLSVSGDKTRFRKRKGHAMSHVRRHANQVRWREQRGFVPLTTPRCERLADPDWVEPRQSFRCPLAGAPGAEKRLRELLDFQGADIGETQKADIVKRALRGDRQGACLAHYNATQPAGSYVRHRPIKNPVVYTQLKALSAQHRGDGAH